MHIIVMSWYDLFETEYFLADRHYRHDMVCLRYTFFVFSASTSGVIIAI